MMYTVEVNATGSGFFVTQKHVKTLNEAIYYAKTYLKRDGFSIKIWKYDERKIR